MLLNWSLDGGHAGRGGHGGAGDLGVAERQPDHEARGDEEAAHVEVHQRPVWVLESEWRR